ncbi:MAG: hypothetical protein HGA45_32105, partial [Chloroflexales bacterium]|nr:hypothetical protein [Chloroflexales bacterium]
VGVIYGLILRGRAGLPAGLAASCSREGLATLGGTLLAGLGLATLPWPLHPVGGGAWVWGWAAFELAFLLPLLPALLSGAPPVARAAIREAQLGALARALLWAALSGALAMHGQWTGALVVAHILALAAALAAFPAAIGWGPFGPEERVTPGGPAAGLPTPGHALDAWARDARAGALLAAILVAGLPVGALPPAVGLALVAAGLVIGAVLLRSFAGRLPRMTLPDALRFCLVWPATLTLAASLALALALAARA